MVLLLFDLDWPDQIERWWRDSLTRLLLA